MSRSSRRPNAPVLPFSASLVRATPSSSAASPFASSSSSASPFAYSSSPNSFLPHRSASPTRVYLAGSSPPPRNPSIRFTLDRSTFPCRSSLAAVDRRPRPSASASLPSPAAPAPGPGRRTCMCSPTTHPGSFRCSLHKGLSFPPHHAPPPSYRLNARRSAMTNSVVRIGAVEGDLVKRALAALIRPSSHQQRRRANFCPRPSRLSIMSKADDL